MNLPTSLTLAAYVSAFVDAKEAAIAPVAGCRECAAHGHAMGCRDHRAPCDINAEETDVRVFLIREEKIADLRSAVARWTKRAGLLGVDAPAMVEAPAVLLPVAMKRTAAGTPRGIGHVTRYPVCIAGKHPTLNGWQFVAAIDHEAGEMNIVNRAPNAEGRGLAATWWTAPSDCGHCATKRRRSNTYLVSDGTRLVQVGSTCIADFLGGHDAEHIALLAEIERELALYDGDEDGEGGGGGCSLYNVRAFLAHTAHVIAEFGWFSKATAEDRGCSSTCNDAIARAFPPPSKPRAEWTAITQDEGYARADAVIAWVKALYDGTPEGFASLGDYQRNLVVVTTSGACKWDKFGLLASVFAAKARADGESLSKRAPVCNEHFGTIGKREKFAFTVEHVFDLPDYGYGITHRHILRDAAGHVATWKTGSVRHDVGTKVYGKATVKEHGDYKGTAQTVLTRCDFATGEEPAGVSTDAPKAKRARAAKAVPATV